MFKDEVFLLVITPFRASCTKALEWIAKQKPSRLKLDLPGDLTSSVERLAEGKMVTEELWRE